MLSSSARARILCAPSSWRGSQNRLLGKTLIGWSWVHGSLQGLGSSSATQNPKLEMGDLTHSDTLYLSVLKKNGYLNSVNSVCSSVTDIQEWEAMTHESNPQQVSQDTLSTLEFYWTSCRVMEPSGMCLRHKVWPFYFQRKQRAPEWKYDLSQERVSISVLGLQSAPLASSFTPIQLHIISSVLS